MNPLVKKLQMKPGQQWLILNAPESYAASLDPLPEGVNLAFSVQQNAAGIQLFAKTSSELAEQLKVISSALKPETTLWVIYPKKNAGIDTDLQMMSSWEELGQYGLRPVASAAVNDVWTALRFKPESLVKMSEGRNAAIKQNDYSAYIDVDNKKVTIPPVIVESLQDAPSALEYLEKLSYSHKKEYVLWILEAKQEKTKADRLAKMKSMLLDGKKNPSAK